MRTEKSKQAAIDRANKWVEENKDRVKEYRREYYLREKDRLQALHKKYYLEHRDEINKGKNERYLKERDQILKRNKNWKMNNKGKVKELSDLERKNLSGNYVRNIIRQGSKSPLKHRDIPDELVEIKRLHLQLKREIKNANKIIR